MCFKLLFLTLQPVTLERNALFSFHGRLFYVSNTACLWEKPQKLDEVDNSVCNHPSLGFLFRCEMFHWASYLHIVDDACQGTRGV